jgi:oligosaccharide repeat unit polymerase
MRPRLITFIKKRSGHPAFFMLVIWGSLCIFYLTQIMVVSSIDEKGVLLIFLYVLTFVVGSFSALFLVKTVTPPKYADFTDFPKLRSLLSIISLIATLLFLIDGSWIDVFDLEKKATLRDVAAQALLYGKESQSTYWLRAAFLLYPVGFVFLALELLYAPKLEYKKILFLGILPPVLAAISMGGRSPILYVIVIFLVALNSRDNKLIFVTTSAEKLQKLIAYLASLVLFFIALYYFSNIFIARYEASSNVTGAISNLEQNWGVLFDKRLSNIFIFIFGEKAFYLLAVFIWYATQGVAMGSKLLSQYSGPWMFGVYGVDLISAITRVFNPQFLANGFSELRSFGVYGFFPSAWGSLYVDLGPLAIPCCFFWGVISGMIYRKVELQHKMHWLILKPFMITAIIFSPLNTPLGFSNGLITYFWLLLAFYMLRKSLKTIPAF